jgi:hypothetical protein
MLIVAERDKEAAPSATVRKERNFSKRVLDLCFLVGSALIVCVLGGGAFIIAEIRHINPTWAFLSLIFMGFFAGVSEGYRREFQCVQLIFFVCGWLHKHGRNRGRPRFLWVTVFDSSSTRGAGFFYMTANWLFGLRPPSRRREHRPS